LKKQCLLLCALFLITLQGQAQEREYIVTKSKDTIYGSVTRGTRILNPAEVQLKFKDEAGNKSIIAPAEVKTIRSLNGVDGDSFIYTIHDQWFVKRIIDGRIKVYKFMDVALLFISKDDSEITSAEFGGFSPRSKGHAQIKEMIKDNPEISLEFDTMKGSEKNIFYIINKYNEAEKILPAVK